jgi:hypothetical protein
VSSKQSIFFRFEPKQTETQSFSLFFGLFCETQKNFFRFVSVFRTGVETTETNRILSKQTKTNRKNLQKMFSIRGSSKPFFFFSVRTKTNRNLICLGCFSVCFFAKPKHFFGGLFRFFKMFRTSIETTETNRIYGMGN